MKQVVFLITFLSVLLISFAVLAQTEKPEIVTDRPDQTEAPVLVPKGGLQVETGFVYENDKSSNIRTTNYDYNTTLIKYGVNENFELRFITGYAGQRVRISESAASKINGFSPIALGVKIKLAEETGIWPQAALISHVNLKAGSDEFESDYTSMNFRFTFAHTLSNKFALSYNVGAEWDGTTPEATFLYTLSLGYLITSKLSVFIETYSFFPEASKADNRLDGGFTYKISPIVQVDFSGGIGLSENAPDSFLSTGISFRLFK
jgi:hypothetical protein